MKNMSRRDFGKAMAATAVVGGSSRLGASAISSWHSAVMNSQNSTDSLLEQIADYVEQFEIKNDNAYSSAHLLMLDSLACCFYSLSFPACTRLLGPIVPGTVVPHGARVPGTNFVLDPVQAAFNISCMVRWLDFNDVGQGGAAPGTPGHPSDNLGGILACGDYVSRMLASQGKPPLLMSELLTALIKAYEVQSVVALNGSSLPLGFDYVWWTKIATAAVVAKMLGGNKQQILNTVSQAFADLTTLRLFRDEPTYGSRESWNSAEATSRGVRLAFITLRGEDGYPTVLTAKKVGVYDALYKGKPFEIGPFGSSAIERAVLKPLYPSEIAIQSPLECAVQLHPVVKGRLDDVERIFIWTYSQNWSHVNEGDRANEVELSSPAARGHDLKYATVVGLIYGKLTGDDYEDRVAADPRINALRDKTVVTFERQWASDAKSEKAPLPGAVQVQFKDGSRTNRVEVEYPLGHPSRRAEAIPFVLEKFKTALRSRFSDNQQKNILTVSLRREVFEKTPVNRFLDALAASDASKKISQTTVGRTG